MDVVHVSPDKDMLQLLASNDPLPRVSMSTDPSANNADTSTSASKSPGVQSHNTAATPRPR